MVRTKANNACVRKAVAAKAPRKQVGGPRQVSSPASSGGKSRKRLGGGGGNPVKVHPIPSWQKGIDLFLNGNGSPHRTMGSTSSTSSTGSSQSEEDDTVIIEDSTTQKERVEDINSDQEERESEEDEEDLEIEEDEEDSEEGENSSCLALLPDDLVTLGSDDEEDN